MQAPHQVCLLNHPAVQIALFTSLILSMPILGGSLTKSAARIAGAMFGGWLFFGLYIAVRVWWALGLLLGAFAFMLVALGTSGRVPGLNDAGPVALMSAFVGEGRHRVTPAARCNCRWQLLHVIFSDALDG